MENGRQKLYIRLLAALGLLLLAVYLGFHIASALRKEASFYITRPYTAKDSATFTGYLFREETVLTARTTGLHRYHYYDGEKVAAGRTVVSIYRFGGKDVEAALDSYKKQIQILKRSEALGRLTLSEVETKIERLTYRIAEKNAAGDTASADVLSDELLVLMAKKDLLESGKDNYDTEIALLENELYSLVSSLGVPSETVSVPRSGYFYAETDGYESIFTADKAKNLTITEFDALLATAPMDMTNAVGTLVTSAKWYYVTKTSPTDAEGFTVGRSYDCLFIDNGYSETIPMKLTAKNTDGEAVLLTFFASTLPADFDISRCQRMEAVRASYTGLRVPAETVRVQDGVTYVYIMKEGMASMREIEILWEQNGYFIVSETFEGVSDLPNLSLNDLIILDDEALYEGKFIH